MLSLSGNMILCGKIAHHKHPTPALDHNCYRWDSPWTRPRRMHQPPASLNQIVSLWTHYQPSVPSEKKSCTNIQPCDTGEGLKAYINGWNQDYDHTTTLKMLSFQFFFNDKYFAKILSFSAVASKFNITIVTYLDPSINIHLHYGTRIIFKKFGGGSILF